MKTKKLLGSAIVSSLSLVAHSSFGTVLYSENFDVNSTASWLVNSGPGVNTADFFFDYSTVGIPPAPRSGNGSTLGMKLNANNSVAAQAFGGISVSPFGRSLLAITNCDSIFG